MKRKKYNGTIGKDATDKKWHIMGGTLDGDRTACGLAEEGLGDGCISDGPSEYEIIETRERGFVTCEDCLEMVFRWREILGKMA